MSRTQYQYTLEDPDGAELALWAPRLLASLRALPALRDVSTDLQDQGLGTAIAIDRSTAARLGVTPQVVDDTLYDAFGQRQVAVTYTPLNQYHVVMEVDPRFSQQAPVLREIYARSSTGALVPLSAFARFEQTSRRVS